jgi:hypothetical protein
MKKQTNIFLVFLMLFLCISGGDVLAGVNKNKAKSGKLNKPTVQNQFTMGGNNWNFEMTNYGPYAQDISGRLPSGGGAGGQFPKGCGYYIIYAAGFQVGALVDGIPKVSVIDFDSEFQPGALEKTSAYDTTEVPRATDPGSATNKLFALYSDYSDGTPLGSNGDGTDDYANWPSQYGAPTKPDGTPLVIGDLMSWCVYNDMDRSRHVLPDDSQMDPLGIEVQQASIQVNITGYSDVFFMYYKVINKGTQNFSNVYIASWFDADVDKSSNDLVATDSSANMVFTYNSDNTDPGSAGGSAFGADFFQGPVVAGAPTDTAKYLELTPDGFVQRVVPGKKTIGLSTTVRYINVRGPDGDPDNDAELYNLMRGLQKNGDPRTDGRFTYPADPLTAPASALDPRPDDKRMMLSTGPFNLAVGDTQVVVVGCIGGRGTDRLNAIENLRRTDLVAQQAYDAKFLLPQPPPSPNLMATPLDGKVVLQWDNTPEVAEDKYPELANLTIPGYKSNDFAGYKVYRSPSGTVGSWTMLAQFDKKDGITELTDTTWIVQDISIKTMRIVPIGDDKGLKYSYIDNNVVNGQTYYYAVTSYDAQPNIRSGSAPLSLESVQSRNSVRAIPKMTPAGALNNASLGQTVEHRGTSDGSVTVTLIDPTKVTGHTYRVVFENVSVVDTVSVPKAPQATDILMWKLFDVQKNSFVKFLKVDDPRTNIDESYYQVNQASATDPSTVDEFVTVDGMLIRVYGPALDFKNFEVVQNASGPLVPSEGGAAGGSDFQGFPCIRPTGNQQVGPAIWLMHTGDNGSRASYASFVDRTTRATTLWSEIVPFDFEMRFTARGSWAFDAYGSGTASFHVPFELWNIGIGSANDTADDYQMVPYLLDDDASGTFNMGLPGTKSTGTYDHSVSGGGNDPYTDWIYWQRPANTTPGRAGYLAAEAEMIGGTYDGARETEVMARMVLVNWNGDTSATLIGQYNQALPEEGTIFRITSTKPNAPVDTFIINTKANSPFSRTLAESQLDKHHIKVVPNPYYGFSAYDQNQFNRRVKITGLPAECTVRIFNVAGDLVRTLHHNDLSSNDRSKDGVGEFSSTEIWDLTSDNGLFISSGVYFLHIDAPGIGQSKGLIPFAIIQGSVQLVVPTN